MVISLYNIGNPHEAPLTGSLAAQCYSQMGTARLRALAKNARRDRKACLDSGLLNHKCRYLLSNTQSPCMVPYGKLWAAS